MKRYDFGVDYFDLLECTESPTGEYVKFNDLEAYADEIRRECKADADRLAEALKELVSIVKIHTENMDNNFAWAEMPQAIDALAAHDSFEAAIIGKEVGE